MNINRRRFLRIGSFTTAGLPFIRLDDLADLPGAGLNGPLPAGADLYESFKNPTGIYRPFVRWWWNGDRLQKEEILRELDVMKAAGIGGVEINPIKFPSQTDDLGIKSLEWLSDEWISMLEAALKGAKEKGIYCDMIVGSGWPFGGEFLNRDDQTQMVALGTRNLTGDKSYTIPKEELLAEVNPDIHSRYDNKLRELVMLKLVPMQVRDLSQSIDLSDQVTQESIQITVPKGEYVLYFLVKLTGYMAVINGAPGAGGPVLNHYSKSAVENYLNRMSDRLVARIGPLKNYFRAFFTDSLELEGANWCTDMFEQFQARKGYDLAPWFPFILFKVGEMGNATKEEYGSKFEAAMQETITRVRYDFEDVRVALFKERFMEPFVNWCKHHGVQSRMQAYGRECNPVEASMLIDIPECETWLDRRTGHEFSDEDYRVGRAYTMSNKFVSSGAHLAGRKAISCEEMTNTEMVFNATLETIKLAGDQSILSGVTHSVLHGFNYSPPQAPFPGWIRYGTYFNEQNPWWPHFKKWSDYKTRLYSLLQQGEMQADIALLPPLGDLSGKFGFQRDPFPVFAYPKYVYQVWEAIHQNGSGCDYVTEDILRQASISNGKLAYGTRSYHTLILLDVGTILPETAKAIQQFTRTGGKLICIEKVPGNSPTNQLKSASQNNVIPNILENTLSTDAGLVPAPVTDFVGWYREIQRQFKLQPHVEIANPNKFVSQVYYRCGEMDVFFFSNYNATKTYRLKTKFTIKGKRAWLWDPHTGNRFMYPSTGTTQAMEIQLGPSESRLIVFDTARNGPLVPAPFIAKPVTLQITGPWKILLTDIQGRQSSSWSLEKLVDFSQDESLKTFGGTVVYETVFEVAGTSRKRYLHLGETHGVCEIEINGKKVATQWYGAPWQEVSAFLRNGNNTLRIKLVTTLGNYMKSLKDNKVAQNWTQGQPMYPVGLIGPVRIST